RGFGLQGGVRAIENTSVRRDRRLRFNSVHLAELLQHPIVQHPKSVRCTLKLAQPSLFIAIYTFRTYDSRNFRRKLLITGPCKLVVLAERCRDTALLTGNGLAHLLHPVAELDCSQMVSSNELF